jgi:hypothetical protein
MKVKTENDIKWEKFCNQPYVRDAKKQLETYQIIEYRYWPNGLVKDCYASGEIFWLEQELMAFALANYPEITEKLSGILEATRTPRQSARIISYPDI